jgi:hypothetical protein
MLRRRREAANRLPPMRCGHRDPLHCLAQQSRSRRNQPRTVISLRASLDTLRRAWIYAGPDDRDVLAALAAYLREVAA